MIFKVQLVSFVFLSCLTLSWAACNSTMVTRNAFFDVSIGDDYWGRIVIGLFDDTTPITSLNFGTFASNHNNIGYYGTTFTKVYPGMAIQGGDLVNYNGTGSFSIFNAGEEFPDENFIFENRMGWIGMANRGPNTNGCQFFINTSDNPGLNGYYVVFAKVLSGFDVVMKISSLPLNSHGAPNETVTIVGSGTFYPLEPYPVSYDMPYYY